MYKIYTLYSLKNVGIVTAFNASAIIKTAINAIITAMIKKR